MQQQQRWQRPHVQQQATRPVLRRHSTQQHTTASTSSTDDLLTAEQRLQLQLRSLPTVSVDGLSAAAAAASSTAAAAPENRQHQQQQHNHTNPPQQQRPGAPLSWLPAPLASRLQLPASFPRFDGRLRGLALLNVMVVLMGSNWVCVKASADAHMTDSMMFMAMRFGLAAALFLPFLKLDKKIAKAGLEVGAWYAGGYVTQALALAHTAASRASLLSTFTVLAVPLIAGMSGQRIRPIVWACSAAALAGTAMLEEGSSLGPPNVGDAWAVVSAICFAFQMFAAEKHMHDLPKKSELPLMAVSMLTVASLTTAAAAAAHAGDMQAAAAGVQSLISDWQAALPSFLGGGGPVAPAEAAEAARTMQQLLYTSVISTNLVLFVELIALQDVSSTDAAMIYSLEPVAGALMAYAFLGERWGAWGWAGGGDDDGDASAEGAAPVPVAVAVARGGGRD